MQQKGKNTLKPPQKEIYSVVGDQQQLTRVNSGQLRKQ